MSQLSDNNSMDLVGEFGTVEKITLTNASAASAAKVKGKLYTIMSDQDFHFIIADTPTATTDHQLWPKLTPLNIRFNSATKIAFIRASADGTVTMSPRYGYFT